MSPPTDSAVYAAMEEAILSGQVPDRDIPSLLIDAPAFATWYAIRAAQREAGHRRAEQSS